MKDFNRQGFLGKDFEAYLIAKVAIIGMCGGGSHVAQQLIHMGFMNLVFIDFDVLDATNLTRMVLARLEDVGSLKVNIALKRALEVNSESTSLAIPDRWQNASSELIKCEYIFSCVDSLAEREQIEMFCRKHGITMIDIGMNVVKNSDETHSIAGQVFLSRPREVCMKCFDFFNPKNDPQGEYGEAGPRPQVVFSNGILASNAVNAFVKMISKSYGHKKPNAYMIYESETDCFTIHPLLELVQKRGCEHY